MSQSLLMVIFTSAHLDKMMLQLNPTIPIFRVKDSMKGFAFMVIDYSQEHNLLFVCAMDNGEIWTLSNQDVRIQKNVSLGRNT